MTRPLAPYDDAVPHPAPDAALSARFAAIRDVRPAVDLGLLRDVVLLVSSSRGGSSMLTEILRGVEGLLTLPGEMNPHVVIAQLAGGDADVFLAELARDVGRPARAGEVDGASLLADVRWRFATQWPHVQVDETQLAQSVGDTVASAADGVELTRRLVAAVSTDDSHVTEAAYDIGAAGAPALPREPVVEMTPYVAFRPWRHATDAELSSTPLVIATPRNAYRLEWLAGLFPAARVRVLHLTRNPAASINGLIDGWRSPWFHNVRVGGRWWKYDVPPSWRELLDADLPRIAAEQWRSPHAEVLDVAERTDIDVLRVRYEDLVGDHAQRQRAADALGTFLGVHPGVMRSAVVQGVPPVMATAPPQRRRWSATGNDLAPALGEPEVWDTAVALGYDVEERLWI